MSDCSTTREASRDTAYQAGYKDGYQMGKSAGRTCKLGGKAEAKELFVRECLSCGLQTPVAEFCCWCGSRVVL